MTHPASRPPMPVGSWNWAMTVRRSRCLTFIARVHNLQYARGQVSERSLSIGELSERTGVAVTALRYYDELGLVRPQSRVSGQRRYAASAVRAVGVVLFLRDVGFSLGEIGELVAGGPHNGLWSELIDRKLTALAEKEHRLAVARVALEHARDCPAQDPTRCPRFWTISDARLDGESLEDSHTAVH